MSYLISVSFYMSSLDHYLEFHVGLLRQPKWGHLKDLHRAIKLCEPALISGDPTVMSLGNSQEVGYCFISLSLTEILCTKIMNPKPHTFLPYRLMFSNRDLVPVLLFLQTTTNIHLQPSLYGISITICLLGRSASFPIARTLYTTQQG